MFPLVLCINISICLLTGFTLPNESKAEEVSDAKDCVQLPLTLIRIKNTQPHIFFAMTQCTCVFLMQDDRVYENATPKTNSTQMKPINRTTSRQEQKSQEYSVYENSHALYGNL